MNNHLGIVEFRNIIKALYETHQLDFNDYALTSLKRRLEKTITVNNFRGPDDLISRLHSDKSFIEVLLKNISVQESEMFRDPQMWRELRDRIVPRIANLNSPKIWVGCATSGEELFSLLITLMETDTLDKIEVIVTSISERNLDQIRKGIFDSRKTEISEANYLRYDTRKTLTDYFIRTGSTVVMDSKLTKNVSFVKHSLVEEEPPSGISLVLYRNKLIYFNPNLQFKVLKKFNDAILPGGFMVLGIMESLDQDGMKEKYQSFIKTEKIYKKLSR